MPNIAVVLKGEIARLARKESRRETAGLKKALAQGRRDIAALRRAVAALSRQVSRLGRKGPARAAEAPADSDTKLRFTAKGLRTQRKRLGLSAAEYGKLVSVSAQSIYKWERELARPRQKQIARLAALRGMGKKDARRQLDA